MVAITDEVIQVGSRARETFRCQEVINIELRLGLVFMNLRRMTECGVL